MSYDSIDYLKNKALPALDSFKSEYLTARENEMVVKKILDEKEVEAMDMRVNCKSEAEYSNRKRDFLTPFKNEYENAKEETRQVVMKYDMLKTAIALNKWLIDNEDTIIRNQ